MNASSEVITELFQHPGVRIERIVSMGQASPPGFYYDQSDHEWVALLSGEAEFRFEDEISSRRLRTGDWLWIEAHRRHRVEWTSSEAPTVWLAVHVFASGLDHDGAGG